MKLPNQRRSKKTAVGAESDRAGRAAETADQRSERLRKLRVRDRAKRDTQTASVSSERQANLQRLLYSGKVYVKEGERNLRGDRNEVTADERQTGS